MECIRIGSPAFSLRATPTTLYITVFTIACTEVPEETAPGLALEILIAASVGHQASSVFTVHITATTDNCRLDCQKGLAWPSTKGHHQHLSCHSQRTLCFLLTRSQHPRRRISIPSLTVLPFFSLLLLPGQPFALLASAALPWLATPTTTAPRPPPLATPPNCATTTLISPPLAVMTRAWSTTALPQCASPGTHSCNT